MPGLERDVGQSASRIIIHSTGRAVNARSVLGMFKRSIIWQSGTLGTNWDPFHALYLAQR